ncbi:MAG: hypothetical protein JRJ03_09220 [Deltaproteobacteria bacterium]|nr:hypothetical protein [Deltaproteobacteria bacterium]
MKYAVPAEGPDLDAKVSDRLGASSYLLVVDLELSPVDRCGLILRGVHRWRLVGFSYRLSRQNDED